MLMKKIIITQFIVLLAGTVFAWGNFTWELVNWMNQKSCATGCVVYGGGTNPFFTACFYGALFFTLAFVLNVILLKKNKH
jgi:hypothetical protein